MQLAEPIAVPDVFVSGLSHIEMIGGGCVRFVCYSIRLHEDGTEGTPVIVAKIVMPLDALPDAISKAMGTLTSVTISKVTKLLPHLH